MIVPAVTVGTHKKLLRRREKPMIRTVKRVAAYARFSSDNQRAESIDAQLRAIREYCKQHKYIIVEEYVDEARSGTTDRRASFQRLIADSKKKSFDIVLVHKLDRFSRLRSDAAIYKRELKKNGVSIRSVLENPDDSPESIMLESVLEGMNEYYSQNLAREKMKGLKETAFQCKHTGGTPPLGYDIDEVSKRLILNEYEAETVKIIFDMYAKGYSYSPILERLHREGRKTKSGNDFRKNSHYGILTNPKYQGIYAFNRCSAKDSNGKRNTHSYKDNEDIIAIDGGCPQIIDKETYDTVQKRITENKHTGGKHIAKEVYLLSGKVFCADCGRAMVINRRRSGRNNDYIHITYRCPSRRYSCSNKEVNREYLESYVVSLLEHEILNTKALNMINKSIKKLSTSDNRLHSLENIKRELVSVHTALQNIADAIAAGLISESLTIKLNELEIQKMSLEQQLRDFKDTATITDIDPLVILSEYAEVKRNSDSVEYKTFICNFIDRIEIGRYTVNIRLKTGLDIFPELERYIPSVAKEYMSKERSLHERLFLQKN